MFFDFEFSPPPPPPPLLIVLLVSLHVFFLCVISMKIVLHWQRVEWEACVLRTATVVWSTPSVSINDASVGTSSSPTTPWTAASLVSLVTSSMSRRRRRGVFYALFVDVCLKLVPKTVYERSHGHSLCETRK